MKHINGRDTMYHAMCSQTNFCRNSVPRGGRRTWKVNRCDLTAGNRVMVSGDATAGGFKNREEELCFKDFSRQKEGERRTAPKRGGGKCLTMAVAKVRCIAESVCINTCSMHLQRRKGRSTWSYLNRSKCSEYERF